MQFIIVLALELAVMLVPRITSPIYLLSYPLNKNLRVQHIDKNTLTINYSMDLYEFFHYYTELEKGLSGVKDSLFFIIK